MSSQYQIEKGVPLAPHGNKRHGGIYPFRDMEVGDSFVMDKPRVYAACAATQAAKKIGNVKFSTRIVDESHTRIWRVA